jgi:archaellum component FlaF (FlaF/FlaG flagellin family)
MGMAHAVAFAVLAAAAGFAGVTIMDSSFSSQESLAAAWDEASSKQMQSVQTQIQILDVTTSGTTVFVNASNAGSITLNSARVLVLLDGAPTSIDSYTVAGATSSVWAPATTMWMQLTSSAPTAVTVVTQDGVKAYWRT